MGGLITCHDQLDSSGFGFVLIYSVCIYTSKIEYQCLCEVEMLITSPWDYKWIKIRY